MAGDPEGVILPLTFTPWAGGDRGCQVRRRHGTVHRTGRLPAVLDAFCRRSYRILADLKYNPDQNFEHHISSKVW